MQINCRDYQNIKPMALPAPKVIPTTPSHEEASDACPRILVVDDSRATREVIKSILGDHFSVFEFADGLSVWERIESGIDAKALITDIDMPGIDGVELISRIRKSDDPQIRNLPIIAITGAEDQETRRRAFMSGATGFIIKPIDAVQLQALLHAYVHHDNVKRELDQKSVALEQQSVTDPLTGLRSRRYFMDRGEQDVAFCLRREKDLSLIRIDIDQFAQIREHHSDKRINDLLKWLGKILLANARVEDTVARLSETEFAILAMATNADAAQIVCGRLREAVTTRPFSDGNVSVPITLTFGTADLDKDHAQNMDALLALAQKRLAESTLSNVEPKHSIRTAEEAPPSISKAPISVPDLGAPMIESATADPIETLSVEELEQLIRQEVKPKDKTSLSIESALQMIAHGKGDDLHPHLEKLMLQLQPLLDYYDSHRTKK